MKKKDPALMIAVIVVVVAGTTAVDAATLPFGTGVGVPGYFDGVRALAVADLDRDGDVDFVLAAPDDNEISIFRNDGDGSNFPGLLLSDSFTLASSVAVGDIDGDGWLDVAGVQQGGLGSVKWWENPDGAYATWPEHTVDIGYVAGMAARIADLDGDGDGDIITAHYDPGDPAAGQITWLENHLGEGAPWDAWIVQAAIGGPESLEIADKESDGDLDILVSASHDDLVCWLENDGSIHSNDSWTRRMVTQAGDDHQVRDAYPADLDRDGDLDVVVAAYGDNQVVVYERLEGAWDITTLPGSASGVSAIDVADLDLDGDLDVLAALEGSHEVVWWPNDADDPSYWHQQVIATSFAGARDALAADLDGDGDPDVLGAAAGDGDVSWWPSQRIHPRAQFTLTSTVSSVAEAVLAVTTADMDNDGDLDLVGISENSSNAKDDVFLWSNLNGFGSTWSGLGIDDELNGAADIAVGDLNGDGANDIVVAATENGSFVWFEQTPSGYTRQDVASGLDLPSAVNLADIDGNGTLDVVGALRGADEVWWWSNENGDGSSWAGELVLPLLGGCTDVTVVDINVDGLPDIVTADPDEEKLLWLRHSYGGSPPTRVFFVNTIDSAFKVRRIESADLNADGRPDVLATDSTNNRVAVWLNGGTGSSWTKHLVTTSLNGPWRLATADFDTDGDVDISVVSLYDDRLRWYANLGGSGTSWLSRELSTSVDGARGVCTGDLDRDGMIDIVSAAWLDGAVAHWRNGGGQTFFDGSGTGVTEVRSGELVAVVRLTASLPKRASGDANGQLADLFISWEDAVGQPYTQAQVRAMFDSIAVYHDSNGNGTLDPFTDLWLTGQKPIVVDGTIMVTFLDLPTGAGNPPLDEGETQFLVVLGVEDAPAENQVRLQTLPRARYYALGSGLTTEGGPRWWFSDRFSVVNVLFSDGFECGDTSRWSTTIGG